MSAETIANVFATVPPGVDSRHRTSNFSPVQIPDLIGVKDRHYLDRTGLQPQHSIGDLMRYAALNQGGDFLASFDGFIPADIPEFKKLPDPKDPVKVQGRYSDEQLHWFDPERVRDDYVPTGFKSQFSYFPPYLFRHRLLL